MITKDNIVGVRLSAVLAGKGENMGTQVEEFGDAFWTEFVIRLENGLLLSLNEYNLVPYTRETEHLRPAELENSCMDPAYSKTYERSEIEGRVITFVGSEPHDSICVFVDSGLGIGTYGGPGGNQLSIRDDLTPDMVDYWASAPVQSLTPTDESATTGQPATPSLVESEESLKPQPETKGRSR